MPKFSQISTNSTPASSDFGVGVSSGGVDQKSTWAVIAALIATLIPAASIVAGMLNLLTGSGAMASYTNTGSGGGTGHYINLGGIKLCWGVSGSFSAPSGANYSCSLPVGFFTTMHYASLQPVNPSASGMSYAPLNTFSNTTLSMFVGTTVTMSLGWFAIGV